jgi:hypothetical protein
MGKIASRPIPKHVVWQEDTSIIRGATQIVDLAISSDGRFAVMADVLQRCLTRVRVDQFCQRIDSSSCYSHTTTITEVKEQPSGSHVKFDYAPGTPEHYLKQQLQHQSDSQSDSKAAHAAVTTATMATDCDELEAFVARDLSLLAPTCLCFDQNHPNWMFVAAYKEHDMSVPTSILYVNLYSGKTFIIAGPIEQYQVGGIIHDPIRNALYVALDQVPATIFKVSLEPLRDGKQCIIAPLLAPRKAPLNYPKGMVLRRDKPGSLIVAEQQGYFIREFNINNSSHDGEHALKLHNRKQGVPDVAHCDLSNNGRFLYLAGNHSCKVLVIDLHTESFSNIEFPQLPDWVYGIATSPDGKWVFFTEYNERRLSCCKPIHAGDFDSILAACERRDPSSLTNADDTPLMRSFIHSNMYEKNLVRSIIEYM